MVSVNRKKRKIRKRSNVMLIFKSHVKTASPYTLSKKKSPLIRGALQFKPEVTPLALDRTEAACSGVTGT